LEFPLRLYETSRINFDFGGFLLLKNKVRQYLLGKQESKTKNEVFRKILTIVYCSFALKIKFYQFYIKLHMKKLYLISSLFLLLLPIKIFFAKNHMEESIQIT